jgi:hypothetical protein
MEKTYGELWIVSLWTEKIRMCEGVGERREETRSFKVLGLR